MIICTLPVTVTWCNQTWRWIQEVGWVGGQGLGWLEGSKGEIGGRWLHVLPLEDPPKLLTRLFGGGEPSQSPTLGPCTGIPALDFGHTWFSMECNLHSKIHLSTHRDHCLTLMIDQELVKDVPLNMINNCIR